MKIGIIDSGIDQHHPKLVGTKITGISIEYPNNELIFSDDITDTFGHGTACAGIIRKHNPEAELFIVKILSNTGTAHEQQLQAAIRTCLDNGTDIINISIGIQTNSPSEELTQVCAQAFAKGAILVAAAHNSLNLESYPSHFPTVIGVVSGKCKAPSYGYTISSDYFIARGDIQRVLWKDHRSNITGGTSFACAHMTGIISNLLREGVLQSISELNTQLIRGADPDIKPMLPIRHLRKAPHIQRHDLDQIGQHFFTPQKNDWIGHISLFPASEKELNTFREFPHACRYPLVQSLDYPRNTRGANRSTTLSDQEWEQTDTLVLGYFADHQFEANNKLGREILRQALSLDKNLFLLDPHLRARVEKAMAHGNHYNGTLYTPSVDSSTYERMFQFRHLPEVSVPIVAVVGTSNKQGKFTTQLSVKHILEQEGYSVAHITTEPHGELFGATFAFPYGHKGTVDLPRLQWLDFLRTLVKGTQHYNHPDLILTGTQGSFIPRTYTHIGDVTTSIDYIFGIQPDAYICAINPQDTLEQIQDLFHAIRIFTKAKPLFCVLTPHYRSFLGNDDNIHQINTTLHTDEYTEKMSYFQDKLGLKVLNILDQSNNSTILSLIENAF